MRTITNILNLSVEEVKQCNKKIGEKYLLKSNIKNLRHHRFCLDLKDKMWLVKLYDGFKDLEYRVGSVEKSIVIRKRRHISRTINIQSASNRVTKQNWKKIQNTHLDDWFRLTHQTCVLYSAVLTSIALANSDRGLPDDCSWKSQQS